MRIRLQGPGHAAALLAELNRCRQSRRYCDVVLQVGNRSFVAHRAVLACAGTYFRNLFTRAPATAGGAVSLEFISPANLEKVLTFVYTGEILTDLIDVGVLYELAERLGMAELVRACHAVFPDMQAAAGNCKPSSPGDLHLDPGISAAAAVVSVGNVASVSASSVCSSAASCSSLSSSAAPTPAAAPSPLLQPMTTRAGREAPPGALTLDLKAEDVHSQIGYGEMAPDHPMAGEGILSSSSNSAQCDGVLTPGPALRLKTEEEEAEPRVGEMVSESTVVPLPQGSDPNTSCSFPNSSAQLDPEAAAPSAETLGGLQVGVATGGLQVGAVTLQQDGDLIFTEVEEQQRQVEEMGAGPREAELQGNGAVEEEEQWRQLAGEIIELSDDDNFMEEEEEEEDDDLVYVENGDAGNSSSQVPGDTLSCKACTMLLPSDPGAVRRHADTHLTELGLCKTCGASFPDRAAAAAHALCHVGVQIFSCDMCHLQFCSRGKLLRHHHREAAGYSLPQEALTGTGGSSSSSSSSSSDLSCAACNKTLSKDFQTLRKHLLVHVCPQSLSCGLCQLPHLSLCALLWHCLTHLATPVFSCPHCARCFLERPLLDRHVAAHAEEAALKERLALRSYRAGGGGGAAPGGEELHCFLCPQTFRSASAFQYHLSLHTNEAPGGGGGAPGWSGKRKAEQPPEAPPPLPGSLLKMGGLGAGSGFNLPDKFFQPSVHGFPSGFLSNGTVAVQDGGAAAARGKWYRCRYCGKRFAHSGEFTYHLRIHTGEKPYQCKVCLRFFRGRSTMICHLKTHAGALMYRCTVCGLYFSTLKLVSSHMELHKDHLPPDFNIEQTFMYNDHSKEPLPAADT